MDIIEKVELQIIDWARSTYALEIGVSIQLLEAGQGESRHRYSNPVCNAALKDQASLRQCNSSDEAMKALLLPFVRKNQTVALGYRCPKMLSNVVIPYRDHKISGEEWFIFLGQFVLLPHHKCSWCTTSNQDYYYPSMSALARHQIRDITAQDIGGLHEALRDSVHEGMFYRKGQGPALEKLVHCQLDLGHLIACKVMAVHMFGEFLGGLSSAKRKDLKHYVKEKKAATKDVDSTLRQPGAALGGAVR